MKILRILIIFLKEPSRFISIQGTYEIYKGTFYSFCIYTELANMWLNKFKTCNKLNKL